MIREPGILCRLKEQRLPRLLVQAFLILKRLLPRAIGQLKSQLNFYFLLRLVAKSPQVALRVCHFFQLSQPGKTRPE